MSASGLSSGADFLTVAAKQFLSLTYQQPNILVNEPIDAKVGWRPALQLKVNPHLTLVAEASDSPYPSIFGLRRRDVERLEQPIAVYCICPEENFLSDQEAVKRLVADGYGLLTVASDGQVTRRASTIPLIQQITEEEFRADIRKLPQVMRARLAEAFDKYKSSAPAGAADIAEVFEGLVLRAGRDAVKKSWILASQAKPGASAATLTAMSSVAQLNNAAAAIAAARAYIGMYRNMSHHFPKNKAQAAKKYRDCRHGFLEGLKKVSFFREAIRGVGLSGGI